MLMRKPSKSATTRTPKGFPRFFSRDVSRSRKKQRSIARRLRILHSGQLARSGLFLPFYSRGACIGEAHQGLLPEDLRSHLGTIVFFGACSPTFANRQLYMLLDSRRLAILLLLILLVAVMRSSAAPLSAHEKRSFSRKAITQVRRSA
jgi:hypothetical protein